MYLRISDDKKTNQEDSCTVMYSPLSEFIPICIISSMLKVSPPGIEYATIYRPISSSSVTSITSKDHGSERLIEYTSKPLYFFSYETYIIGAELSIKSSYSRA